MTTTDIATVGTSELAIQNGQTYWNDEQLSVLRQIGAENVTRADLKMLWHQCVRTGLDPFVKQIHLANYGGKAIVQTGIDGFRLIARRATDHAGGTLGYEDTQWCGPDGQWVDVWLSPDPPTASRVTVLRDGQRYPAIALYTEYVGKKRDGNVNSMWRGKPALMLAKCAEALALRKAFPHDLSGLYTTDEMQQASNPTMTVASHVVPDDMAPDMAGAMVELGALLDLVEAATTEAELRGIWSEYVGALTIDDRARLSDAMKRRKAALDAEVTTQAETPATDVGDDTVADAEIVDDEPAPSGDAKASKADLEQLVAAAERLGITKPGDIRAVFSALAGRAIARRDDLTAGEAATIRDELMPYLGSPTLAAAGAELLAVCQSFLAKEGEK